MNVFCLLGDDFDEIMDVVDEANSTIRAFKIHVDTNLDSTLKTLVETLPGPRRIVLLCDIGCQVKVMQRVGYSRAGNPSTTKKRIQRTI